MNSFCLSHPTGIPLPQSWLGIPCHSVRTTAGATIAGQSAEAASTAGSPESLSCFSALHVFADESYSHVSCKGVKITSANVGAVVANHCEQRNWLIRQVIFQCFTCIRLRKQVVAIPHVQFL